MMKFFFLVFFFGFSFISISQTVMYPCLEIYSVDSSGKQIFEKRYADWREVLGDTTMPDNLPVKVRIYDKTGNVVYPSLEDKIVRSLSCNPLQQNILYAGLKGMQPGDGYVCRSTDYGRTWIYLNNHLPLSPEVDDVQTLEVSPHNDNFLLAGTWKNGLFRSTDAGFSFQKVGNFPDKDIRKVVFDSNDSLLIYCATISSGVIVSKDRGNSWITKDTSYLNNTFRSVWGVLQDPVNNEALYALTYSKGLFKSTDRGGTWNNILEIPGQICYDLHVSRDKKGELWLVANGKTENSFFNSSDAGVHWKKIENLSEGENFQHVVVAKINNKYMPLTGGKYGLYVYDGSRLIKHDMILPYPAVSEILTIENKLIISTWGNGLIISEN